MQLEEAVFNANVFRKNTSAIGVSHDKVFVLSDISAYVGYTSTHWKALRYWGSLVNPKENLRQYFLVPKSKSKKDYMRKGDTTLGSSFHFDGQNYITRICGVEFLTEVSPGCLSTGCPDILEVGSFMSRSTKGIRTWYNLRPESYQSLVRVRKKLQNDTEKLGIIHQQDGQVVFTFVIRKAPYCIPLAEDTSGVPFTPLVFDLKELKNPYGKPEIIAISHPYLYFLWGDNLWAFKCHQYMKLPEKKPWIMKI